MSKKMINRTMGRFLLIYLLAMTVLTSVWLAFAQFGDAVQLEDELQLVTNDLKERQAETERQDGREMPTIGDILVQHVNQLPLSAHNSRLYLYDTQGQLIAQSGTMLGFEDWVIAQQSAGGVSTFNRTLYCPLDDALTSEALAELWGLYQREQERAGVISGAKLYQWTVVGSLTGSRIDPSVLTVTPDAADAGRAVRHDFREATDQDQSFAPGYLLMEQRRGIYNARVQQGFDRCDQLAADVRPQLTETAERRIIRQGLLGRDMVVIQPVSYTLDEQDVGWLVLAASRDAILQTIAHLAKVYGICLLLFIFFAWLNTRENKRQEADA